MRKRVSRSRITGHQCCFILLSIRLFALVPPLLYVLLLLRPIPTAIFYNPFGWEELLPACAFLNKRIINYSGFFVFFVLFAFVSSSRLLPRQIWASKEKRKRKLKAKILFLFSFFTDFSHIKNIITRYVSYLSALPEPTTLAQIKAIFFAQRNFLSGHANCDVC